MIQEIPWARSLSTKLGGITLALLGLTLILVAANLYTLQGIKSDAAHLEAFGRARKQIYEYMYLAHRRFEVTGAERDAVSNDLRDVMAKVEARFSALTLGDLSTGTPGVTDEHLRESIRQRREQWNDQIKPALTRLLTVGSLEEAEPHLRVLRESISSRVADLEKDMDAARRLSERKVERFEVLQYAFIAFVLVVLALVFRVAQSVARRTESLATTAERIASGDLQLAAPVTGSDEIAALGMAFNAMTAHLRRIIESEKEGRAKLEQLLAAVAETTNALASGTSEILAGTTQQASGAQEQATAVSETVTTVDEVTQTADQAAQRARSVAESSQRSLEISRVGRKAVEDTIAGMGTVKEQVEGIAESILALADQAQAIGEIIATVNDIAEQTNILALNAGIEASRAGEQGKGFSVVAAEVKALADQAKKATAQVRQLLGDIQKATNSAVMAAEDGTKSVNDTTKLVLQAGDAIKQLSETIAEAAQSAAQIAASAGQQAAGMSQIHQAMKQVSQATNQSLASTRQQERAAQDLNVLGTRLKQLMGGFGR
ncbi:MAG: methyl-accepting chemotaxis protein [Myxococcota bacterium]